MKDFICDNCGKVDYVLMDGYTIGGRLLEGVMFKITIKSDKSQDKLIAKVQDKDKSYFTNNHINIKQWEKEMGDEAQEDYDEDGCCDMICPKCENEQVIMISDSINS